MRNVSGKTYREDQNTNFVFSNFFYRKSWVLCDNAVKYGRSGQATDDNIIRRMCCACWITTATDTHTHTHTHRMCNTYSFSTTSVLARTDLIVTFLPVLFVISGFRREVDEIWALLDYYAAYSGNFLSTFRDSLSVPSSRVMNSKKKVRKESPLAA